LFWDLSLAEINDLFESYERKRNREREQKKVDAKDQAMFLYNLSTQIADAVAQLLPGNAERERIPLAKFYPDFFKEEAAASDEEKRENELALHKARMEDYVHRYNEALRKRGEGNGRNDS